MASAGGVARLGVGGRGPIAAAYRRKILELSPIAYWPLYERTGAVATCLVNASQNGSYTGVTLNRKAAPNGDPAPLLDGVNDVVNTYSVTFRGAFDGAELSLAIFGAVDKAGAAWNDGNARALLYFSADNNNFAMLREEAASPTLLWRYKAGGTTKQVQLGSLSTTDWFSMVMTVSATADEMIAYWQGEQTGLTQTGLGAWAGLLQPTLTVLGAVTSGASSPWLGYLAQAVVWDRALTPAEVLEVATI